MLRAAKKQRRSEKNTAMEVPAMLIAIESIKGLIQNGHRAKAGGNISGSKLKIAGTPVAIRFGSNRPTTAKEPTTAVRITSTRRNCCRHRSSWRRRMARWVSTEALITEEQKGPDGGNHRDRGTCSVDELAEVEAQQITRLADAVVVLIGDHGESIGLERLQDAVVVQFNEGGADGVLQLGLQ